MGRCMKVLFVLLREVCDCSVDSFYIDYRDGIVDEWLSFEEERPKVCHYKAILFRDRDSLNKYLQENEVKDAILLKVQEVCYGRETD